MNKTKHYQGLTEAEVLKSRELNGENVLTPPEKESLWKKFIGKFYKFEGQDDDPDPLIRILLVAGILSIIISCYEFWGLEGHGWTVFFEPIGIFVALFLFIGSQSIPWNRIGVLF